MKTPLDKYVLVNSRKRVVTTVTIDILGVDDGRAGVNALRRWFRRQWNEEDGIDIVGFRVEKTKLNKPLEKVKVVDNG